MGNKKSQKRLTKLSRSIAGKIAIVTGAGSGIGRATAHLFADEGARVVLTDLNAERVKAVTDEIISLGYEACCFICDVAIPTQCRDLIRGTVETFGSIDILINNAGTAPYCGLDLSEDEYMQSWQKSIDVNLTAQARLIYLAYPYLKKSGSGRVVNISSTETTLVTGNRAGYAASKHGVIGLTQSLAVELGLKESGITVNCICPGPILTGMTAGIPQEIKEKYAQKRTALLRYGDPEELAHAILHLVLPASSYITGVVLVVDGGLTIRH